ncbi:Uncharacterised protein [Ectopseudomonas mendocina]|uniref:Uncharacterized protein n=1 Tax=Ectopseudomonas mendocina TaxID=300 RepID=A0A379PPX9_ECTME|nr:hypothetical protein [Pseudomonas mendocina]SUE95894.1 Uncharacterised protein [Pseudomonas mendocina]
MSALIVIGWFIFTLVSIGCVLQFVGSLLMVEFFPEGKRWWMWPLRWVSLAFFAGMVLINPFWGPMA